MLSETWARTSDILTIVTPLLVGGSVALSVGVALLLSGAVRLLFGGLSMLAA